MDVEEMERSTLEYGKADKSFVIFYIKKGQKRFSLYISSINMRFPSFSYLTNKKSGANKDNVKFSLKVVINKQKTKVLFAEIDSDFADVLLSFLTLPLGKIVKILEEHYGDEAPIIGSLNTLYNGLSNLHDDHFWTEGGKKMLLDPVSSSSDQCRKLKLDIADTQPTKYFSCEDWKCPYRRHLNISMYYGIARCQCGKLRKRELPMRNVSLSYDDAGGVFTVNSVAFIISDDLQILPNVAGSVIQIVSNLSITDADWGEIKNMTFGFNEIMDLLKGSFLSRTPLTDLILKKRQINLATPSEPGMLLPKVEKKGTPNSDKMTLNVMDMLKGLFLSRTHLTDIILNKGSINLTTPSEPGILLPNLEKKGTSNSAKMTLKVILQKSTNKLLFAQAEEDFIDVLFSLLMIPLGGVGHLLEGRTCLKNIDNLYKSVTDLIGEKFFKSSYAKNSLIAPKLPHGYLPKSWILPVEVEKAREIYFYKAECPEEEFVSLACNMGGSCARVTYFKFPTGYQLSLKGPRMYMVPDDLSVTPLCMTSFLSNLNALEIPLTDVTELVLRVGPEEVLSVLKASLVSKSALSNGLSPLLKNQPKQEH